MRLGFHSCVAIIFVVCCCNFPLIAADLGEEVTKFLEEFRVRMCHPFPQWHLPALDPFQIKHEEIFLDNKILKNFTASVTNLKAVGLSDFILNDVWVGGLPPKFNINLTIPLEEVQSQYVAKGSLAYIVDFIGDDNLTAHVKYVNIVVSGSVKLGLKFGLKNLNVKINVGELFVDLGKLMEPERLNSFIHALINELGIELLGDLWEDYGEPLTVKLQDFINDKLGDFTLGEIIGIISGSGEPIFGDDPPGDCKNESFIQNKEVILIN